jgi:hypothetical protein
LLGSIITSRNLKQFVYKFKHVCWWRLVGGHIKICWAPVPSIFNICYLDTPVKWKWSWQL